MKMQLIHAKADLRFSHRKNTNFSPPRKGFGEKNSFYEKNAGGVKMLMLKFAKLAILK